MLNDRYSRQTLFDGIGIQGQTKLLKSRALVIGVGALGTSQAELLGRAGVGCLRIVDRDFVEFSNLQRQSMFTEHDARDRLPKVVAAENHLREVNSEINIESEIADVNYSNVERLIKDCDIVLDGTDNFATRYLINDACVKHNIDWIYGAAVGSYGVTMTICPRQTPCLKCIFEEAPDAGTAPTCDTAGVIMPIINMVAAVQVTEALKLLTGQRSALHGSLMQFDVWQNQWREINPGNRRADCETCGLGLYETLSATSTGSAAILCGRDAIQISPQGNSTIDLEALAKRLRAAGDVKFNEYLLRFTTGDFELTVFRDARSIVRGTNEIAIARSLYAKYIGN